MANNRVYSQDIMTASECDGHYNNYTQNNTFVIDGQNAKNSNRVYSEDTIPIKKFEPLVNSINSIPFEVQKANDLLIAQRPVLDQVDIPVSTTNESFVNAFSADIPMSRDVVVEPISTKPSWFWPVIVGTGVVLVLGVLFFLTTLKKSS